MNNTGITPFTHDCSVYDRWTGGNCSCHGLHANFSCGTLTTNPVESTDYNTLLPYVGHYPDSHSPYQVPSDQAPALSTPTYDFSLALNTPLCFQKAPQYQFTNLENQHSGRLYQDSINFDDELSEIWSNTSRLSGQTDVSARNCQGQLSSDPSVRGGQTRSPARKVHNKAEKKYRSNVRDSLAMLRDSVPALRVPNYGSQSNGVVERQKRLRARNLSKTMILSEATRYIRHLEQENNRLVAEKTSLEATINILSHILPDELGAINAESQISSS